MRAIFEYHRPTSLDAALTLLSRPSPVSLPLAGGSHGLHGTPQPEALIDLGDLNLAGVARDAGVWRLGATTTLDSLAHGEGLPDALRRAARRQTGRNVSSRATLGGAIATADSGPLLVCLLALRCQVHLEPGARIVPLNQFLAGPMTIPQTLIVAVSFQASRHVGQVEIARTPADAPILSVAIGASIEAGTMSRVSVAAGAAGQPLAYLTRTASLLEGRSVEDLLDPAAVAEPVDWLDDVRSSAEYRAAMLPVLLQRALGSLAAQRTGGVS